MGKGKKGNNEVMPMKDKELRVCWVAKIDNSEKDDVTSSFSRAP
jgi:hypothetical protein